MDLRIIALGKKIHRAMKESGLWGDDLSGGCAVGSALLVSAAKEKLGINLRFRATHSHAWTEYQGTVYDITACQFDNVGEMLILRKRNIDIGKAEWYVKQCYLTNNKTKNIAHVNRSWPREQQPSNYQLQWINQHKVCLVDRRKMKCVECQGSGEVKQQPGYREMNEPAMVEEIEGSKMARFKKWVNYIDSLGDRRLLYRFNNLS